MAKDSKEKKDALSAEAKKAQEQKEAKKKIKAAEKSKPGDKGGDKADAKKAGGKKGKKVARWLRDFRGEIKKIVWPDFKTVMKSTGIVIVTVIIIGSMIWIVDFLLTNSITLLKNFAGGATASEEVDFEEEFPAEFGDMGQQPLELTEDELAALLENNPELQAQLTPEIEPETEDTPEEQ